MQQLPEGGIRLYVTKTRQFSRNARLVLLYSAFNGLVFGVFQFVFNFYILSLGYDEAFIGTLQTLSSLAAMLMALPAAYVAERFSQKRVMVLMALFNVLSIAGIVLFPQRELLIGFRILAGMSMLVKQVVIAPFLMSNTSADERQWVFSFNFGLMTVSGFVGSLLGGLLPLWLGGLVNAAPTDTLAYQLAIASMMLVAATAALPLAFIRMPRQTQPRVAPRPWRQLREHGRSLTRFLLPQLIIGLGAGLMQPFMNIYFRHVYHVADAPISIVFAIGGLAMAIAQFLGPPLADKYGKIGVVIQTQVGSIPFLLTLGLGAWLAPSGLVDPSVWFIIASVAFIFRLALMNLSNPVYQTFVLEHVPERVQALAMSLSSISFQFGWFIMPQLSGWLQVRFGAFGFVPIFGLVTLFYGAGTLMQWAFFVRRQPTVRGEWLAARGE
jgi:MFS family permease